MSIRFPETARLAAAGVLLVVTAAARAGACACGCGVFDVGTSSLLPMDGGGLAYVEYDVADQNRNWHNSSHAPANDNNDKDLRTHYITAGAQYMFSRRWGAMVDVPVLARHFDTLDENGSPVGESRTGLGDIRLRGLFTGFSPDLSRGLTLGLKLPTGNHTTFDRDTAIGSGSTDILAGGFARGRLTASQAWDWFSNVQADLPVLITPNYRPGTEVDLDAGVYYDAWTTAGGVSIAPVAHTIATVRWSDTGTDAAHEDSGYQRLFVSPGIEISSHGWRLYVDVAFPVLEKVNGNQLVASEFYKLNVSRRF